MGSRININLVDLLLNPSIEVHLTTFEHSDEGGTENTARITFLGIKRQTYALDYLIEDGGSVALERDFNFFRNAEEHSDFMRCLFETSVPFQVYH